MEVRLHFTKTNSIEMNLVSHGKSTSTDTMLANLIKEAVADDVHQCHESFYANYHKVHAYFLLLS